MIDKYYRGCYREFKTLDACIAYLGSKSRIDNETLMYDYPMSVSMADRLLERMEGDLLIKEDYLNKGQYDVNLEAAAQFTLDRREVRRLLGRLSSFDVDTLCFIDMMWRSHRYSVDDEFDTVYREELMNLMYAGVVHCFDGRYLPSVDRETIHLFSELANQDYIEEIDKLLFAQPILRECLRCGELPRELLDCALLTPFCTEYISEKFRLYSLLKKMPPVGYVPMKATHKLDTLFERIIGNIAEKLNIDTVDSLLDCVRIELVSIKDIPPIANAKAYMSTSSIKLTELLECIINQINGYSDEDIRQLKLK